MTRLRASFSYSVGELFAGVGGFRLGLENAGPWQVVWSNQWEPGTEKKQFASRCYSSHFGADGHSNEDIAAVLDRMTRRECPVPKLDLLVGGFPCQDYSVAKPLNQAHGLVGKKGILWWEINRFLELLKKRRRLPPFVLLENVDRLLNSPAGQRGRDFAMILASLARFRYDVEWRVVNAADYGQFQRRRRVFILATPSGFVGTSGADRLDTGILAQAFECSLEDSNREWFPLEENLAKPPLHAISERFGRGLKRSPFKNAGFMRNGIVWTGRVTPRYSGPKGTLRHVLVPEASVPGAYYLRESDLVKWRRLKDKKNESRTHKSSQQPYRYSEGALPFPDRLDEPSRTVLTAEGGTSPSRFRHVVEVTERALRRLTPTELERLNGFPEDWTATGMSDAQRAFCMGNALVVPLVERIGTVLARLCAISGADSLNEQAPRVNGAR